VAITFAKVDFLRDEGVPLELVRVDNNQFSGPSPMNCDGRNLPAALQLVQKSGANVRKPPD
jgi:hypothetical protein